MYQPMVRNLGATRVTQREGTFDIGKSTRDMKVSTPYCDFDLSDHDDDSAHDAQQEGRLNLPTPSGRKPPYLDTRQKSTPPISRGLAGLSIRPSDDMASSPSISYTTSDSSILADSQLSPCRRLINNTFPPHETISLIEAIFTSKAEIDVVRDLRGDSAQKFIDVVHEVCRYAFSFSRHSLILRSLHCFTFRRLPSADQALDLPSLPPWLRKKCLSVLCKICGRRALLPRSLKLPLCYNRSENPLYRGGYADVWKGEHEGRHVAVKVLRVYSTSDFEKITSVRISSARKHPLSSPQHWPS